MNSEHFVIWNFEIVDLISLKRYFSKKKLFVNNSLILKA